MLELHNQCFQRQSLDFLFSLNWSLSSHISERLDGMSRNLLCRYRMPKQRNLECFQRCLRWVRENPDRTQYLFPKCTLRKFQLISLITTNYNVECAVPALCTSQKLGFSACLRSMVMFDKTFDFQCALSLPFFLVICVCMGHTAEGLRRTKSPARGILVMYNIWQPCFGNSAMHK